jgi:AcrR family transcriptional regulator
MVEDTDTSSRQRILAATAEVLGRNGMTKLSLSEVATQAGVSRPTLYRYFADKRELLDGFVVWERQFYERAVADATADLPPCERLDAALRVIVEYQQSYPGLRMIDIEPAQVIRRLSRVIPLMRARLERLASGPDRGLAVSTAVRVAISHYLVRSDDDDDFLDQLRHAARVKHFAP